MSVRTQTNVKLRLGSCRDQWGLNGLFCQMILKNSVIRADLPDAFPASPYLNPLIIPPAVSSTSISHICRSPGQCYRTRVDWREWTQWGAGLMAVCCFNVRFCCLGARGGWPSKPTIWNALSFSYIFFYFLSGSGSSQVWNNRHLWKQTQPGCLLTSILYFFPLLSSRSNRDASWLMM